MALLDTLVRKYGKTEGRKRYNRWHRLYRKRNKPKMLEYWAGRRADEKANKTAASSGSAGL